MDDHNSRIAYNASTDPCISSIYSSMRTPWTSDEVTVLPFIADIRFPKTTMWKNKQLIYIFLQLVKTWGALGGVLCLKIRLASGSDISPFPEILLTTHSLCMCKQIRSLNNTYMCMCIDVRIYRIKYTFEKVGYILVTCKSFLDTTA